MKKVLTVAGSDSGGGAGIQADLKTFAALRVYGTSVITALTAQNTLGVHGVHPVPAEFVARQLDAVLSDMDIEAAKTGMLVNADIIEVVARKVKDYGLKQLVVDPVMVATTGGSLLAEKAEAALKKELLPLALLITPNLPEAEVLTGRKIKTEKDMRECARILHDMGVSFVLIKGGHLEEEAEEAVDILYDGANYYRFTKPKLKINATHGSGCTLSAALTALLAQGLPVEEAVARAKEFVFQSIKGAFPVGKGVLPVNPLAML
ncbi:bifunctional hydroxymethylpyrimidine kinase/phosphomethylpyrimidine kinase [Calderihabitans maritimus]|uniref:Hydroxymethylpyrimidine/phosphomethylpyrimidine kinase n=1 Tax=Calderihabitans maritimus TaxID=1246530 RepID=A0A1Z5HSV9_9FIRM|nr:bifunctional hydroxymethylpyrimidine kinase/phosphomethylpyrimidine kinase [Calderihabitans maritimus]GAW92604.1 phosphomethylpyrimidine kinase [Calderihabitans maritimus]